MPNNLEHTVIKSNVLSRLSPIESSDSYFMSLAIEEAKKGLFTTRPNPAVGCIIVKNDVVIGTGFHPKAGMPHAEIYALNNAQSSNITNESTTINTSDLKAVQGATAYVTLEPCSHTGRTPPCAQALINSGISRVVIAGLDPNPQVAGRGVEMLLNASVKVSIGVANEQAEELNQGFLKAMRTKMPYVRLKIATSLDGRTAMESGESKWITGSTSREDVQKLRALSGAIITGSQTIINDDPKLDVRSKYLGIDLKSIPQPKIVVLDRRQRLYDKNYQVFKKESTLLTDETDLNQLLKQLVTEFQIYDVLVESGATLAGSFLESGLVDELIVYQAPCLLGHTAQPMIKYNISNLANQQRFNLKQISQVGEDIKLVYKPLY